MKVKKQIAGDKRPDVFVKDEGEFATIIFQTIKAMKMAKQHAIGEFYGDHVLKVDVDVAHVSKILTWARDNNLLYTSEIPVKLVPKYAITDREAIRKAIGPGMPDEFYPKILKHVGISTFRGDSLDKINKAWSMNDRFEVGQRYPVYHNEGYFVVGSDGKGYKMTREGWSKFYA